MILRGMASRSTPEISRALLNYSHNELQMWFSVYFLLLILIFSLFPLSLLQQARIHNLDLIKNRILSYTCEQVKNQCQRNWGWGRFSERNTWNHFSKCSVKGLPNRDFTHNYSHSFWRNILSVFSLSSLSAGYLGTAIAFFLVAEYDSLGSLKVRLETQLLFLRYLLDGK